MFHCWVIKQLFFIITQIFRPSPATRDHSSRSMSLPESSPCWLVENPIFYQDSFPRYCRLSLRNVEKSHKSIHPDFPFPLPGPLAPGHHRWVISFHHWLVHSDNSPLKQFSFKSRHRDTLPGFCCGTFHKTLLWPYKITGSSFTAGKKLCNGN